MAGMVRRRRIDLGMSVRELAEQTGVEASYIYAIEGEARGPHFDKIVRIAKVLDLDWYELAAGIEVETIG